MCSPKTDAVAHGELPCCLKGPQNSVLKSVVTHGFVTVYS